MPHKSVLFNSLHSMAKKASLEMFHFVKMKIPGAIISIPPNQFRQDHPWMRFVLLDSSAGPVPSQAKVTRSLMLSLKKIQLCTCRSTETSTDDVLRCLTGRVDKLVHFGCISTGRSVYTLI